MNIKKYFSNSIRLIDKALDRILPKESAEPRTLHKAMRYSVFTGGKRIRPIIVIESAKACGRKNSKGVLAAACAIELVHSYSLIHDDLPCMDNDDYRRGKPTCHRVFGEANAVLAGDALLTLAFKVIAESLPAESAVAAIRKLSSAIGSFGMVGGQAMDIAKTKYRSVARVLNTINTLKTAKLFEASAAIGAISAGADGRRRRALASYGLSVGIAFQIADDIIDGEGYARIVGHEKARRDCEALVLEAKASIASLGLSASVLKAIADYIGVRRR
ncbi:MAG: polyprenyl synthetase family protein [Candidatus Omnitrophica bacterium]|nr:polyprenyl synthetase family protein [Candidatus Omnitrophota bacterium]MCM8791438.1 polyprenyl synthetase family protein [Candidatus Omnitrophota bacterium]